jgi:hypothetical protein
MASANPGNVCYAHITMKSMVLTLYFLGCWRPQVNKATSRQLALQLTFMLARANLANPNTSEEAKEHSRQVLSEMEDSGELQTDADSGKNTGNVSNTLQTLVFPCSFRS